MPNPAWIARVVRDRYDEELQLPEVAIFIEKALEQIRPVCEALDPRHVLVQVLADRRRPLVDGRSRSILFGADRYARRH